MDSHNSRQGIEDEGIVKEDTWSSGQLVPVFMLLVPLLLIVEGCSGKTRVRSNYDFANFHLQI